MKAFAPVLLVLSIMAASFVPPVVTPTLLAQPNTPERSALAAINTPTATPTPAGGDCQDNTCG